MDLDEVLGKAPSELNDEEKKLLGEKWDDLEDADKEVFKDFAPKKEGEGEEAPPAYTFKSEDDFKAAVKKANEESKKAEEEAAAAEEQRKKDEAEGNVYIDPKYVPKDWNDAFKQAAPKIVQLVVKEISQMNATQRQKIDEINKEFDTQIDNIAAMDPTVPAKGTPEREQFEADLAKIGAETPEVTDMYGAFKIYKEKSKETKKDDKGSEEAEIPNEGDIQPALPKKEVPSDQKNLAKKVSKGGSEKSTEQNRQYIHGRSVRDVAAEAIEREGLE